MSILSTANVDATNISGNLVSGNSTVNLYSNSTILQLRNTTVTTNVSAAGIVVGVAALNSTAWAIGANVWANATTIIVGNTIVNTTIGNNTIYLGNSSVNSTANSSGFYVGTTSVLRPDVADQTISGGARVTVLDNGTKSSGTFTPDPGDRPMQKYTNAGAHTLAPGTNYGNYIMDILNTTGAGAITVSGWTKVAGDSFDTTTTSKFRCFCSVTSDMSLLQITKIV